MSRVPWSIFANDSSRAHLVVASMPSAQSVGSPDLQLAQTALLRFVRRQKPTGDYATAIVRQAGPPQVLFAFEKESDARLLTDAIHAQATGPHADWASVRSVDLEAARVADIFAGLPAPRTRPRLRK